MTQAVLIVEPEDARRAQLRAAFSARGVPVYDVADAVDAMVAVGRADFGALVASEGKRHLSLQGLCLLARRRHPGIQLLVMAHPDVDEHEMRERLGVDLRLVPHDLPAPDVVNVATAAAPGLRSAFEQPAATEVVRRPPSFDDDPRTDTGSAPTWQAPPSPPPAALVSSGPSELSVPPHTDPVAGFADASAADFGEPTILDDATQVELERRFESTDTNETAAADALRADVSALCERLAVVTRPAQVLGVPLGATLDEVNAAYEERMAALDPSRVGHGSAAEVLRVRVEELRARVTRAYEALRLQLEATGKHAPAAGGRKRNPNPW